MNIITFFTNFLSSWKKRLLSKISQYSQESKHLCLLKRDSFIKTRLQHWCFSVNIAKCFRTSILKNSWERLLLRLTLGSHFRVPPQGPTLGSYPRVLGTGSHLRVLGPTFLVCLLAHVSIWIAVVSIWMIKVLLI